MTLEMLQKEMMNALKNKDKLRNSTLSNLVSAVKRVGIDNNCRDNISEEMVNAVLRKELKILQEMIDTCPPERAELLAEYQARKQIVDEFTPKVESNVDTIKDIISNCGLAPTKKNFGAIMKVLREHNVDMTVASQTLKDML